MWNRRRQLRIHGGGLAAVTLSETEDTHHKCCLLTCVHIYGFIYICLMRHGVHVFEDGVKIYGNHPKKKNIQTEDGYNLCYIGGLILELSVKIKMLQCKE